MSNSPTGLKMKGASQAPSNESLYGRGTNFVHNIGSRTEKSLSTEEWIAASHRAPKMAMVMCVRDVCR